MEFSSFDDDLFGESKTLDSKANAPLSGDYVPKVEYPCWFLVESSAPTKHEFEEKERMRAAFLYWRRDYENAAQCYDHLLNTSSSSALKLECMESYARALIACDRFEDGERISTQFYNFATNYDQQLQALNLLSDLYWVQQSYKRCTVVSAALALQLDSGNADIWYRLGHCFLHWNSVDTSDCSRSDDLIDFRQLGEYEFQSDEESRLRFRTCLVRAYNFLTATYGTSVGCARQRNEQMRFKIESDFKDIIGDEQGLLGQKYSSVTEECVTFEGENADNQNDNSRLMMTSDGEKMLDVDLVTAFKKFVIRWLK